MSFFSCRAALICLGAMSGRRVKGPPRVLHTKYVNVLMPVACSVGTSPGAVCVRSGGQTPVWSRAAATLNAPRQKSVTRHLARLPDLLRCRLKHVVIRVGPQDLRA